MIAPSSPDECALFFQVEDSFAADRMAEEVDHLKLELAVTSSKVSGCLACPPRPLCILLLLCFVEAAGVVVASSVAVADLLTLPAPVQLVGLEKSESKWREQAGYYQVRPPAVGPPAAHWRAAAVLAGLSAHVLSAPHHQAQL